MHKNKINILLILVGLIIVPSVLSEQYLGTFKQNECMTLIEVCDNCTFVRFNSVLYPNGDLENINLIGEKYSSVFNTTFCNTTQIGTYIINSVGDLDGINTSGIYSFEINPSGQTFNNVLYDYLFFALITTILYSILWLAFKNFDKSMAMITSFGILILGVYIFANGIANLNNIYTNAFSIINVGLGAYILLRSSIEMLTQEEGDSEEE